MKIYTSNSYPQLRIAFESFAQLGAVINKDRTTIWRKMNGAGFTDQEQKMILSYLGMTDTKETREAVFKK